MLEKQFIIDQEKKDIEYYSLKDQPEAAKAAEHKVTKDALDLSDRLFQHFKDYEKLMEKQLEAAGRKSDPYRASQPDDKQDPSTLIFNPFYCQYDNLQTHFLFQFVPFHMQN